jgi:hypothetical protein
MSYTLRSKHCEDDALNRVSVNKSFEKTFIHWEMRERRAGISPFLHSYGKEYECQGQQLPKASL